MAQIGEETTSQRANAKTNKPKDRERIWTALYLVGLRGYTPRELEILLNNRVSASIWHRCSDLQRDLLIVTNGEERPTGTGCMAEVLLHIAYATQEQIDGQMERNLIYILKLDLKAIERTGVDLDVRTLPSRFANYRPDELAYLEAHPYVYDLAKMPPRKVRSK